MNKLQCPFLIVAVLVLFHNSTCSVYHILPAVVKENDSCSINVTNLTLTQFALCSQYLLVNDVNTTLMFFPGRHSLDIDFSIHNISEFKMLGSFSSVNLTIHCLNQNRFIIGSVDTVYFKGFSFFGCGNSLSLVKKLTLEYVNFYGTEKSSTALVLENIHLATITECLFVSNRLGSQHTVDNGNVSTIGGAIIVRMASNVIVDTSEFHYNSAGYGGAIYIEERSQILLHCCEFSQNLAIFNGGCIYANSSIVDINKSVFFNNGNTTSHGSQAIVLFDGKNKTATINNTSFLNNSGVFQTVRNDVLIEGCEFVSNKVARNIIVRSEGNEFYYRGVMLIAVSNIKLSNCTFLTNEATEGGGILLLSYAVLVTNGTTLFQDNKACDGTLTMSNSHAQLSGYVVFKNNMGALSAQASSLILGGTINFINNNNPSNFCCCDKIVQGAALNLYLTTAIFAGSSAIFSGNYAFNGGALYLAYSLAYIMSQTMIIDNVAHNEGGGMFLYQSYFSIFSNVTLTSNEAELGGGIYASDSTLVVTSSEQSTVHCLEVDHNKAKQGGGLFFSTSTRLFMYHLEPRPHNMSTVLASNEAEYGGAIYISDETYNICNAKPQLVNSECFLRITDSYESSGTLQLFFQSNVATERGADIFGGLLDRCIVGPSSRSFDSSSGTSYLYHVSNLENTDYVTSHPVKVCFCVDNAPDCSLSLISINVQKGKNFSVSVFALDQAGHNLNASIMSTLQSSTGGLGEGQQYQMTHGKCNDITLSVVSSADHEEIMLFAEGPCGDATPSHRIINVTFTECVCPIGFDVNPHTSSECQCVCSKALSEIVLNCTIETESFSKQSNSWIGYDNASEFSGFIISHICPYDYCLPIASVNLNVQDGANLQCANHRAGRLCGSCEQNYSLSLDQSGCVVCNNVWPINNVLVTLAGMVLGIIIVSVILFLNLTVTAGTINGFIFSANILKAIFPFPSDGYRTYLISFFNLDIAIHACFYDGFDTFAKTWFALGYPVYLIFMVFMVIILCKYSSRFTRFLGKRNPVETLATLIFLSYSKLLQFPITALSCGVLEYPNGTKRRVWLPDASIECFELKHTVMFVVALIVIIVVFIYTALLFFWQWLIRCPNWKIFSIIRNTRLQSLIEMYHIPHDKKHRYWIGLLLFVRIILYLVVVAFDSFANYLVIILLLSGLFVLKSMSTRVYKKWPLDVLESLLIVITIAMAASASYTSTTNSPYTSSIVTYTSTVIVAVLFIIVIFYHVKKYVLTRKPRPTNKCPPFRRSLPVKNNIIVNDLDLNYLRPSIQPNKDRFNSILGVMDPPTESDYHRLRLQQQLQRNASAEELHENIRPKPPTFSSLEIPVFNSQENDMQV